eukprot:TRINITY_DN3485_c0_g2_i2.p2 TRINITY_DN3485_c0_g2~~TRINITY_DN3485_c0_g2_i2.p2  ORF type:complete len:260 (-),score=115.07 TRINITY_DN3485_c0_g2_i2:396-1175(-)
MRRAPPPSAQVLGGFSMGGGVALQCLAAPWARDLAGVFSLSSFLHAASPLYAQQQQAPPSPPLPPLYTAHGLRDDMVSHAWARSTARGLTSAGYAVTHAEYATLGHDMSRAEVEVLLQWIGARVADARAQRQERRRQRQSAGGSDVDGGAAADASGGSGDDSGSSAAHARSIPYALSCSSDRCTATFKVGAAAVALLVSQPLVARGAYFELQACSSDAGAVVASFESPAPHATAEALALRIRSRIDGGAPPGAEECVVS